MIDVSKFELIRIGTCGPSAYYSPDIIMLYPKKPSLVIGNNLISKYNPHGFAAVDFYLDRTQQEYLGIKFSKDGERKLKKSGSRNIKRGVDISQLNSTLYIGRFFKKNNWQKNSPPMVLSHSIHEDMIILDFSAVPKAE